MCSARSRSRPERLAETESARALVALIMPRKDRQPLCVCEREAECFEREGAEQDAVAFFAENDVGAANPVAIFEKRDSLSSCTICRTDSGSSLPWPGKSPRGRISPSRQPSSPPLSNNSNARDSSAGTRCAANR